MGFPGYKQSDHYVLEFDFIPHGGAENDEVDLNVGDDIYCPQSNHDRYYRYVTI